METAIFWSCLAVKVGTVLQPSLKQVKVHISGNNESNHFLSPCIPWKGICNGKKILTEQGLASKQGEYPRFIW